MKRKYCYIIVDRKNGDMLVEDGKLPLYWCKEIAKKRQALFSKNYIIHKLSLSDIEELILKSTKVK